MNPSLGLVLLIVAAPLPKETPAEAAARELGLPAPPGHLRDDYLPDGILEDVVWRSPERYPVRTAVLDAVEKLGRVRRADAVAVQTWCLTDVDRPNPSPRLGRVDFRCPTPDADPTGGPRHKFQVLREELAVRILDLEDLRRTLTKATADRTEEFSPRWQAHLDYVRVEVEWRLASSHEVARSLGSDRFHPTRPNPSGGWQLVPAESPFRDDARKRLALIRAKADFVRTWHRDTVWAQLADDLAARPFGCEWVPVFEQSPSPRVVAESPQPGGR